MDGVADEPEVAQGGAGGEAEGAKGAEPLADAADDALGSGGVAGEGAGGGGFAVEEMVGAEVEVLAQAIEGLLRTMFDPRNNLANDVSNQLVQHFGDKVYRTIIPRNVRLAEAPSHGLPVMLYDAQSSGAKAYLALAGEVLRRHDGGQLRLGA